MASNESHDKEIQRADLIEDQAFLNQQESLLQKRLTGLEAKVECGENPVLEELIKMVKGHMEVSHIFDEGKDPLEHGREVDSFRRKFRALFHMVVSAGAALRSCAQPQKQSVRSTDRARSNSYTDVPYVRYGTEELFELEIGLAALLDVDRDSHTLLLTSSGMSAYQLIEAFFVRKVLLPGDLIMLLGNIYFETQKQLTSMPGLHFQKMNTTLEDFKHRIYQEIPKLIFVESMNNDFELRITDIPHLLEILERIDLKEDVYVVIDGTMIPEGVSKFFKTKNPHVKVLYFASCGKYLQDGMDTTMAGLVVSDQKIGSTLQELRRASGTILYEPSTSLFSLPEKEIHTRRSARMTRNATHLAAALEGERGVDVRYPKLPSHPDHNMAQKEDSLGAVFTFRLREEMLNRAESLQVLIDLCIENAKTKQVPLSQGVSFGFTHPRLTLAHSQEPYTHIRVSAGDRSYHELVKVEEVLVTSIRQFLSSHATVSP